jgi:hypothetical protein
MKQLTILAGSVAAALLVGTLIVVGPELTRSPEEAASASAARGQGLPWQIEQLPDGGITVMGLTLGSATRTSSLADVRRMWGPDVQIAIIAAPGEDGSLEAFVDPAPAGFVTGKLVVTAQLSPGALKAMRERALKTEFMDSSTRKHTLQPEDEALALAAPIVSLSFIPQARLDAEAIVARFGTPARRIRSNGHLEHFLYPDKGLDVVLDSEGKELLQYVAPAAFSRLQQPLEAAAAAASAAGSSAAKP